MGMFDTIAVSDALPHNSEMVDLGLDKRDWMLQTKDFARGLDYYVLQDGVLLMKKYRIERWIAGDPKATSVMDRVGHLHREGEYFEKTDYTGTIRAYDLRQNVGKWDCWCEWSITLDHGKVAFIELAEFRKTDNTERKAREKELFGRIRQESLTRWDRYFFHTRAYLVISTKIRLALYRTGSFFYSLSRLF